MSEEAKLKISIAMKGRKPWNTGKKLSKEHIEKIRQALKERVRKESTKEKMRVIMSGKNNPMYGKHHTEETREKIRIGHMGMRGTGMAGKTQSAEARKKIGDSKRGEKHYRWKGGHENTMWHCRQRRIKEKGNGGFHSLDEWQNLKKEFSFICPCCGKKEPDIKLTVDHIIPISKGGTNDIDNIQPLCRSCNCKKHTKIIKYEKITV